MSMTRNILPARVALALTLAACAAPPAPRPPPVGHQPAGEAAVLAAMDAYMQAITSGDREAMAALQTPEGMTWRANLAADGGEPVGRPFAWWRDPARANDRPVRERYWSPTVLVRGPIAVVWAPYEFWIDGATSHCGIDLFSFVQVDGRWLVSGTMWTVEPEACGTLRPSGVEELRPAP